jgi:DNA-binding transcriptional ArsR family regulator
VLRALVLAPGPLSVRRLSQASDLSHTAAGSVLGDLYSLGLVNRHFIGRSHAYALERNNIYVRTMVLPSVQAEGSIIEELRRDLVAEFAADSVSLILFGSYAFGEQTESSDIDVFALVEDALHKQRLEERDLARGSWFRAKYGSPLALMLNTRREASSQLLPGQNAFRTELAATGIILHGAGVDEWGLDGEEAANAESFAGRGAETTPEGRGVSGICPVEPA